MSRIGAVIWDVGIQTENARGVQDLPLHFPTG